VEVPPDYKVLEPKVSHEVVPPRRDRILNYRELTEMASAGQNKNLMTLLTIDRDLSTNVDRHDAAFNVVKQISSFIDMARASIIIPSEDKKSGFVICLK